MDARVEASPRTRDDAPISPEAAGTFALTRRMALAQASLLVIVAVSLAVGGRLPVTQAAVGEIYRAGIAGTIIAAMLIGLTGLLAVLVMVWARRIGRASLIGRAARRPQGIIVPVLALLTALVAVRLGPTATLAAPMLAMPVGLGTLILAFPLLVMERVAAAITPARLPEARALQGLLFVPVAAVAAAGVLEMMASGGALWPRELAAVVALVLLLIAAELGVRALANWFLPPADPDKARAAIGSFLAAALRPDRLAKGGFAAPIREHLGIDFARSWALLYLRAAVGPVAVLLVLLGWGLSGVSLIDLDQRAVQERFGAPVRVLGPGLHIGLPWPLGRVRRVEFGVVHAVPLTANGEGLAEPHVAAEAVPPPALDRLWETEHPAESTFLIASATSVRGDNRQSFQSVSADLRVLYRIGLTDQAAMRVAYGQTDPDALVRAEAGRLMSAFFAGQTLPALLVGDRESLQETLRTRLQASLDALGSGVDIVGMTIEAIHPPAGAAAAYHDVQAAEIKANTTIAVERGRAISDRSRAEMLATDSRAKAAAAAAETVGAANVSLRQFSADQDAAAAGGHAFLLERYLGDLSAALSKAPVVIIDHRLGGADGPTIDLRTFGPSGPAPDTE